MENGSFINEDYFEHLLAEIREIRLSERRFYQKLTDIYATSIDYNRDAPTTRLFFRQVQNKMHYAFTDMMIYHLYSLTYDEVKVIDSATPITCEEYENS